MFFKKGVFKKLIVNRGIVTKEIVNKELHIRKDSIDIDDTIRDWECIYHDLKNSTEDIFLAYVPVTYQSFGSQVISNYPKEIDLLCQKAKMYARLHLLKNDIIYLMYCIEEGDHGDSDGFGVEPDTWIISYISRNGTIIVPFELEDHESIRSASKMYGTW